MDALEQAAYDFMNEEPKKKPPLGIMPRHTWETKRLLEIIRAIERYVAENVSIPNEWIEEYNELTARLFK